MFGFRVGVILVPSVHFLPSTLAATLREDKRYDGDAPRISKTSPNVD